MRLELSLSVLYASLFFFFFQAEDGIRDYKVTGVQTCALPIYEYSGAVRGLEAAVAVADVAARRHPQASHLPGASVREIVAVQVGCGQHVVLIGARQHLLENGVGEDRKSVV